MFAFYYGVLSGLQNSLEELRRIQHYFGMDHSDDRLKAVIDRCSLRKLKADVDEGKTKSGLMDEKGKSVLYRKGIFHSSF